MDLKITRSSLEEIRIFRTLFLQENNCQFIHNKCHDYGWADYYALLADGIKVGYGCIWGTDKREDRDSIFEFYIIRTHRRSADWYFSRFLTLTSPPYIECQTNDSLLCAMLYRYARNISADAILFEENVTSALIAPGVIFRKKKVEDHIKDDAGNYVLEQNGKPIANGGFLLNYNMPYADIYMEVKEPFRQKGLGSFLVQELKKEVYKMGRVPAARCNIHNRASQATLEKAGFKICGFMLKGDFPLYHRI